MNETSNTTLTGSESETALALAQQRIGKAHWRLVDADPFLCFLLLEIPYTVVGKNHPKAELYKTAATDYEQIYYNAEFINKLSDRALVYLAAHEVSHMIFRHGSRGEGRDRELWNTAADFVINAKLDRSICKQLNGTLAERPAIDGVEFGCHDLNFADKTSEEAYDILKKKFPPQPPIRITIQQKNGNSNSQNPSTNNSAQNNTTKNSGNGNEGNEKKPKARKKKAGNGDHQMQLSGLDNTGGSENHENQLPKNWDIIIESDKKLSESEKQELNRKIHQKLGNAISKALARARNERERRGQGSEPSELERMASEGFKPVVCWTEHLRALLQCVGKGMESWNRPQRQMLPHGWYAPSQVGMSYGRVGAVIDTSGSIDDEQLGQFVAELNELLSQADDIELYVWTCDAGIHGPEIYNRYRRIPPELKLVGGGGTDFRPGFEAAANVAQLHTLVYFTDTWGTFPDTEPDYQTIFVIPEGTGNEVPFGTKVLVPVVQESR